MSIINLNKPFRFSEFSIMENDINDFWNRVKTLIKQSSFTQRSLSESIGLSPRTLEIMMNRGSIPDIFQAYKMAQLLNTSIEYLITGSDPTKPDVSELEKTLSLALQQLKALN